MKKHISLNITHSWFSSMMQNATRICVIIFVLINFCSCTKFVSVPPPKTVLVSETVFDDDATAQAAKGSAVVDRPAYDEKPSFCFQPAKSVFLLE